MDVDTDEGSDDDRADRAASFLRDLPKVHEHGYQAPHSGGLNPRLGQVFIDEIGRLPGPVRTIETGAGNSTLLFMMLGCESVTAIAPDEGLGHRIEREAADRNLDMNVLRYIMDRSERALPRLALDEMATCDVAFIDGNHGWPSVFVDFCYLNMMLREGGLLCIDDVQVYSCSQLMLLLRAQREFEQVSLVGKMVTFRKIVARPFLPDWDRQPLIAMNTPGVVLG